MKDKYTNLRIKELSPYGNVQENFTNFIDACEQNHNVTIRIMEPVFRTVKDQDDLYAIGRTKGGTIVTHAKGGQSYHNFGLAIDICVLTDSGSPNWKFDMSTFKPEADKFGLEWGGDWNTIKDYPHFEMRIVNDKMYSENCSDLFELYQSEKVDSNGYVVL